MNRSRLGPIDIVGITLGVLVILLLAGSIVFIATSRMHRFGGPSGEVRGLWDGAEFSLGGREREEADQAIEGSFTEVEIRSVAGSVEVLGGATGPVQLHSVKTAPGVQALQALNVDVQKLGSRLVIQEKREGSPAGWRGSISFTVTVPKSVTVVRAHSVSGSVSVRGVGPGVDQWLDTVSGAVSTDGSRDLHASSTSGSITFSFAGSLLEAHTVSGAIKGTVDSIGKGGSVTLRTVSGPVVVQAFAGLDAAVDLRSVSGPVSCAFPLSISEQRHNRLQGKIGQGVLPVEIRTTSGPIRIERL
jgi:DUF4097 and DUF4098 domain-containing protein YvlB